MFADFKRVHSFLFCFISKAECYKKTNLKKRYHLAGALKRSGMAYPTARKLGFKVSPVLWKSCNNQEPRNKGNAIFKF